MTPVTKLIARRVAFQVAADLMRLEEAERLSAAQERGRRDGRAAASHSGGGDAAQVGHLDLELLQLADGLHDFVDQLSEGLVAFHVHRPLAVGLKHLVVFDCTAAP